MIYLADSDGPVELELPEQWLWDIIDEFIYQYQVFCTWRSKVASKTADEITVLGDEGGVSLVSVILYAVCPDFHLAGVELLQCLERLIFSHPKIENTSVYRSHAAGKVCR